jgi:hypothetical protein
MNTLIRVSKEGSCRKSAIKVGIRNGGRLNKKESLEGIKQLNVKVITNITAESRLSTLITLSSTSCLPTPIVTSVEDP